MSSTKFIIVYNAGSGPYVLDEEAGTQVLSGEFAAAQRSLVRDSIADNALVIVDPETIGDSSNPSARKAKSDYQRLTSAWEVEKAEEPESKDLPADYDDSSVTKSSKNTRSPKTNN